MRCSLIVALVVGPLAQVPRVFDVEPADVNHDVAELLKIDKLERRSSYVSLQCIDKGLQDYCPRRLIGVRLARARFVNFGFRLYPRHSLAVRLRLALDLSGKLLRFSVWAGLVRRACACDWLTFWSPSTSSAPLTTTRLEQPLAQ